MKVLRIYHGGRDASHRERDRALVLAGVDLTLVVPASWPNDLALPADEPFEIVELTVTRPGDVNRHRYADAAAIADLVAARRPDVVDLHEEPFSSVVHQVLHHLPVIQPVVTYTAQNIDKRFPPPFARWERQALGRVQGIYPCTRQAASVVVGKGFTGVVRVLPLAPSSSITVGEQQPPSSSHLRLLLVGRLVPEKGVLDAVRVLAQTRERRAATLTIVGAGSDADAARALAAQLGVADALEMHPWANTAQLADIYRQAHIVLTPSRATRTWLEQFGRMVVEAQAAGAVVAGYASGSLPEVVGDAGVLVREGDVAGLAEAVLAAAGRWHELRAAGLAAAADRTWEAVAAGQVELYDRVSTMTPRWRPVRARRAVAEATYGPPAHIPGGGRPFALPLLREDSAATRALARAADAVSRPDGAPLLKRMRVVYLDHVARMSGGEVALARLLGALPDVDAHVILAEDGPLRQSLEDAGATVEILPLGKQARDVRRAQVGAGIATVRAASLTALYTVRLARRLRALKPDLVHTNSLKSGYYGSLAAKLAGIPVVWHLRDRLADDYLPAPAARLTRFALAHLPDLVICNSAETLRTAALGGAGAIVASPVVHDPYDPTAVRLGRTGENLVVGMVGRLAAWKGQDVFLRAFAEAFRGAPAVRGRVIGSAMFGEDVYEQQLRTLTVELGLGDRVTFVGFAEHVESELALLDILVHASVVPEPFGQVVVEGMAAGLAVIASAAGGPLEIVTPERDGLLVPPGDVTALAAALRRLSGDPALRDRLGQAATIRARDFGPGPIGERVQELYRDVLATRRR